MSRGLKQNKSHYMLKKSLYIFISINELSYESHAKKRIQRLNLSMQTIRELGYRINDVHALKQKHVKALIEHWKESNISTAEIKNRMTDMRWLAEKIDKASMIPRTDSELGIYEICQPLINK